MSEDQESHEPRPVRRYTVQGHWRRQRVGGEHKLIWIAEHDVERSSEREEEN